MNDKLRQIQADILTWIKMIHVSCLALTAISLANAFASDEKREIAGNTIETINSQMIDGFFVGIAGNYFTTNNASLSNALIYVIWTTATPSWYAIPTKPEYAFQVELLDANGRAMPKSDLGSRYGTKFLEFNGSSVAKGIIEVNHQRADKPGEAVAAMSLFRPSELFKIDRPGDYTLRIQFQILSFPSTGSGRRDYTNHLIRFPPINYPLRQLDVSRQGIYK